ncbi:MAG TPA: class I SAM-dependent methyltransferase [Allosphingosinicella sp.]
MSPASVDRSEAPALATAERLAAEGRAADALALAWRALDAAPAGPARRLVAGLLKAHPSLAASERRDDLARLVADPELNPTPLAKAAWTLLLREGLLECGPAAVEADALALRLLEETFVTLLDAELGLTALRRELLLGGGCRDHPRLAQALVRQAAHNGGAWWFEEDERARLAETPGFAAAFLPPRRQSEGGASFDDAVTAKVADQYRAWPYPAWTRINRQEPTTLTEAVAKVDPGGLPVPRDARVLVAGCGTGRDAAIFARRYPHARITAIDLSETSLAEAEERCAGLGVEFRQLDLHRVAELGRRFDFITCSGVLHHLPDPEAGWAALAEVLKPGGVLRVLVYSRIARLRVRAARTYVADLVDRPVTDDLLRAVRRRLIEKAPLLLSASRDFYTLGGIHDLLLHRHEDPFDVPRIRRAIDRLGFTLLAFVLPTPEDRARYLGEHPEDPLLRSYEGWAALEKKAPFMFARMYEFWCRKQGRAG